MVAAEGVMSMRGDFGGGGASEKEKAWRGAAATAQNYKKDMHLSPNQSP